MRMTSGSSSRRSNADATRSAVAAWALGSGSPWVDTAAVAERPRRPATTRWPRRRDAAALEDDGAWSSAAQLGQLLGDAGLAQAGVADEQR